MEAALQIKNVSKKFSNRTVINNISLDVYKGQVFGLLGPNGAGKTTMIRMIVNLISKDSGDILIEGKSVSNDFERAIENVGAIVENPEFYKYMSGLDNLMQYARMYDNVSKERVHEVAKIMGIDDRLNDQVKKYSLGMRQRLGIAAAILNRPKLLILDEPTNGLDPAGIHELRNYLRKIAKEQDMAVFVSSHILSEMELMCDRIAIIDKGNLVSVKDLNKKTDNESDIKVMFEINMDDKSKDIIKSLKVDKLKILENGFEAGIKKEDIPKLNKELVESGIDVFSIVKEKKSLEDTFMEVTGGEHKNG